MKGPSSDISACSRVVPEGETVIREATSTSPGTNDMPNSEQETELLAKLASPIVPQDATQATSTDMFSAATTGQSVVLGPMLAEISVPPVEGNACGPDGNDATRKQTRKANDPAVETIRSIEFSEETDKRRSWKVIGKLAVLAQSMNAHTIDIYHDRKLNTSRFMIHPNSKLRRAWEVMTVCLVLYVCVMVSFCQNIIRLV